jgi:NAD(P)-dependent dehydrogenase (short-subunit alcohol dehydrogenase family)
LGISAEDIDKIFRVNVYGPIFMVKAAVSHMPNGGRIINVGSTASKMGFDTMPVYCGAKAALDQLTFSWAAEVCDCSGLNSLTMVSLERKMALQSTLLRRVR